MGWSVVTTGVVGDVAGWRWVLLDLLPLCGLIGVVALAGVWSIPPLFARRPAPGPPSGWRWWAPARR